MEVITIESKAWQSLVSKIDLVADYIRSQDTTEKEEKEMLVDNSDVNQYLHISLRTLQRLRASGDISFSTVRGKHYYKLSEVRRMIESKRIKSTDEYLKDLVANNRMRHDNSKRRDTKKNK